MVYGEVRDAPAATRRVPDLKESWFRILRFRV